jgi:hypothetical protein
MIVPFESYNLCNFQYLGFWNLGFREIGHKDLGFHDLGFRIPRFMVFGLQHLGFWIFLDTFWRLTYKVVYGVWRHRMQIWCWKRYAFQAWLIIMCKNDLIKLILIAICLCKNQQITFARMNNFISYIRNNFFCRINDLLFGQSTICFLQNLQYVSCIINNFFHL